MSRNTLANLQVTVGIASIAVGLLLVVGPGTELFAAYERTIVAAIAEDGSVPSSPSIAHLIHWLLATCGAGVVGWGIAWAMISHHALRRGERWAYLCLCWSLVIWVAIDLAVALWFGVRGEVLFVTCALVVAGTPLLLARSSFRSLRSTEPG